MKNENESFCYFCSDKECVDNNETNRREIYDKESKKLIATTSVKIKQCINNLKK